MLFKKDSSFEGLKVLVLGVAYKKNTDDIRESIALRIIEGLFISGAKISYSDPYIPRIKKIFRQYRFFGPNSVALTSENLRKYNHVVLLTDHDAFDYQFIYNNSKTIIDTKGAFGKIKDVYEKIIAASI